jgi:hypothetical protein
LGERFLRHRAFFLMDAEHVANHHLVFFLYMTEW